MIHAALYFAAGLILVLAGMAIENYRTSHKQLNALAEKFSIRGFLNELPDPHRKICIQYMDPKVASWKVDSLKEAIGAFCMWNQTPHEEYFGKLYDAIRTNGELPDPPSKFM